MDLSTLTKLSREQLNAYARRAGIEQPEQRATAELCATLLSQGITQRLHDAERSLQYAKGSGAAQVARGVISALTQSPLLRRFARPDALPETTAPIPSAPIPSTSAPLVEAVAPTPEPHVEPATAPTFATAVEHDDGVPTRRFVEEPIRTRSMARVLLSQGHRDRALAILESIVRDNPGDLSARDDLERLRTDLPLDAELARLPEPRALPTLPETGDTIELRALPGRTLHISWHTTEAGQARAQAVLGTEGELAVRVVAITPDPTRVVRSEITERGPVERVHEWTAPAIEAGSRCFAAIGMRAGGRFVAIAHAPARTID